MGKMKSTMIAAGALIIGSVLTVLILMPISALTVRLPKEDHRLIEATLVSPGDTLNLSYRHSVERTQVIGRFTIGRDQTLLATETRMTSVGTGLPNCEEDRTHREGEWIVVDEGHQKLPDLRFYYTAINQTQLTVAGQSLDFDAVRSGNLLLIAVETPRLIQWGRWLVDGRSWPR
jgi:hypothetical protein